MPLESIIITHKSYKLDIIGNAILGARREVNVNKPPTDSNVPQVRPKFYNPIASPLS